MYLLIFFNPMFLYILSNMEKISENIGFIYFFKSESGASYHEWWDVK